MSVPNMSRPRSCLNARLQALSESQRKQRFALETAHPTASLSCRANMPVRLSPRHLITLSLTRIMRGSSTMLGISEAQAEPALSVSNVPHPSSLSARPARTRNPPLRREINRKTTEPMTALVMFACDRSESSATMRIDCRLKRGSAWIIRR